jgi:hypothetical protein
VTLEAAPTSNVESTKPNERKKRKAAPILNLCVAATIIAGTSALLRRESPDISLSRSFAGLSVSRPTLLRSFSHGSQTGPDIFRFFGFAG